MSQLCVKTIALTLLAWTLVCCNKIDFCDKEICGDKIHVCCGYKGEFARHCPRGIELLVITKAAIAVIVHEHNKFRDFIASGRHAKFEKAMRIPELVWNADLAYTAECHIKSCMNGYDKCRNTFKSRSVSQNIYVGSDVIQITAETLFLRALNKWTTDAKLLSLQHISKFIGAPVIGNFTQIIHETAYKFGCAAAMWSTADRHEYELVCNYNDGNSRGRKIYLAGELNCTTGSSPNYPNLCSVYEPPVDRNCVLAAFKTV